MSSRKHRDSAPGKAGGDDDVELFRRSIGDARPLSRREYLEPAGPRVPARARFTRRDERAVLEECLDIDIDTLEAGAGESLRFHRPSVGRRTMRKLARGSFSVQAEIDLHGMTAAEARGELKAFIEDAARRGHTCVRVIHGKGRGSGTRGPVLKRKVDRWLRQWDVVLAFVSARQNHGGTGAAYVLLRP